MNIINNLINNLSPSKLIFIIALLILAVVLFTVSNKSSGLNGFKKKVVGDGQHGKDRLMKKKELEQLYTKVSIPKSLVDHSHDWKRGRIIDYDPHNRSAYVDTSDTHFAIEAPTEVGKTSCYMIPNIQYNMMCGVSMIIPCIKKELIDLTIADAHKLGYETGVIDFNDPSNSLGFDFLSDINENLNIYFETKDLSALAEAETLAERLALDITSSRERSEAENKFFQGASLGLVHAVTLLVAMYAKPEEKHLGSTRSIIQNILTMSTPVDPTTKEMKSKIQKLFGNLPDDFAPKKHIGAAFAATGETEGNVYSSVLDDLRAINNTLAEQIVSLPTQKETFNYKDLIDKKYILYIHMPETKPELLVFAKLIIRKITSQLSNYAVTHCNGKLERPVYIPWDEWGISPKIEKFDDALAIDRGKNIFYDIVYQSKQQGQKTYGEKEFSIILNQCGTQIVLGLAPTDIERAEELSKVTGEQTILTGTTGESRNPGALSSSRSTNKQMSGSKVLTPGDILRMEQLDQRLVFKRGQYALEAYFPAYYKKEWGIEPTRYKEVPRNEPFHKVKFYPIDDLQESLSKLQVEDVRHTSVNVEVIPKSTRTNENPYDHVIDTINEITNNDSTAILLLMERRYPEFMKHMESYKNHISKFELQTLLTDLREDN